MTALLHRAVIIIVLDSDMLDCSSVTNFNVKTDQYLKNRSVCISLSMLPSPTTNLVMVALCNRADHYIFILFLLLSFFFFLLLFFPHLISAVGDCMSTILRHMVWS